MNDRAGDTDSRAKAFEGLGIVLVFVGFALLTVWAPTYLDLGLWSRRIAYGLAILLALIGVGGTLTEVSRLRKQRDTNSTGDWPVVAILCVTSGILYWLETTVNAGSVAQVVLRILVVLALALTVLGFGVAAGKTAAIWDKTRRNKEAPIKAAEFVAMIGALLSAVAGILGLLAVLADS